MFRKQYLSRAESKVWGMDAPIGDPFGGAAYGEKNDPVTAIAGAAGIGAIGSIAGGLIQGDAAKDAAKRRMGAKRLSVPK